MKIYRIFLPKIDNGGVPIPISKISSITEEIRQKFGAYSFNPFAKLPVIGGVWTDGKSRLYNEPMQVIELFVEDTFDNQKWMMAFKEMTRQKLEQEELFIIVQNAEILP